MRRRFVWPAVGLVLVSCAFFVGRADAQGSATPGSAQDPLASVSYVAQAISTAITQQVPPLITQGVQSAVPGVVTPLVQSSVQSDVQSTLPGVVTPLVQTDVQNALSSLPQGGGSAQIAVVSVPPGQKLVAQAGTEFILRGGNAVVTLLPTSAGGFSDLTSGQNLGQGAAVPANHLLLAARSDGRAITPVGAARLLVIVIGQYALQPAT